MVIFTQFYHTVDTMNTCGKCPFSLLPLLCLHPVAGAGTVSSKSSVAVTPSKAQEFLAKLSRTKRNIWDRSRPDVQQWIMQFMYMGYDEQVSFVVFQQSFTLELMTACNRNNTDRCFKKQIEFLTFEKKDFRSASETHTFTRRLQKH